MIPTKENIRKAQEKKRNKLPKVHQKISNTFIENAITKSNQSALKTIYYLSTILTNTDLENKIDDKLMTIRIDKREMLKFTGLSLDTIIKTIKRMQQTSITFIDEDSDIVEGMSLLPRYKIIYNKNYIEIDLFIKIAKMIIEVQKNYTNINIKNLMLLKNAHSLRLLALLTRISQYDEDIPKRKRMSLDELNLFFGTNYKSWSHIEREILKPIQNELNNNCDLSFIYESNFEALGRGRPKFKDVTIDLKENKKRQGKLF